MAYTVEDFEGSMRYESVPLDSIKSVIAAWGNVDKDGACCDECGGEWSGGFLVEANDRRFAYVTGWCDYTGWGCQDGTSITWFSAKPSLSELDGPVDTAWDIEPSDLNLFVRKAD